MLTRSSRCGNILNGIFGANKKLGGKKLDVAGVLLAKILDFLLHNFRKETIDSNMGDKEEFLIFFLLFPSKMFRLVATLLGFKGSFALNLSVHLPCLPHF